jgi:predicted ester cyclase
LRTGTSKPTASRFHRIRDGKIVEYWSVTDIARVLQQVGALPGTDG